MKQGVKILLAAGAAMLVMGFVMTGVARMIGVRSVYWDSNGNMTMEEKNHGFPSINFGNDPGFKFIGLNGFSPTHIFSGERMSSNIPLEPFTSLDMDIAIGDIEIQTGTTWSLDVKNIWQNYFDYSIDEGTLEVTYSPNKKGVNIGDWGNNNHNEKFVLTIPQGITFIESDITTGVGDTKIKGLNAKEMDLSPGVGEIRFEDGIFEDLSIYGGVGNIDAKNLLVSRSLDVESGVGDVNIQGEFTGEVEIAGSMGEISLELLNAVKTDYNYSVSSGMGVVTIDGVTNNWMKKGNNSSTYSEGKNRLIDITGGVGNIDLKFTPKK